MARNSSGRSRVAILGGGMSALTAAFELTEQDPDQSLFEITVYTLGWRLGGKAAVGREALKYNRTLEHGLHIWAGFYDNAFDVVKRLYARLGKDPDAWKSCFEPLNHFTVMETDDSAFKPWSCNFRPTTSSRDWALRFPWPPVPARTVPGHGRARVQPIRTPDLPRPGIAASRTGQNPRHPAGNPAVRGRRNGPHADEGNGEAASSRSDQGDTEDRRARSIDRRKPQKVADAVRAAPATDEIRRLKIFFDLAFALARGCCRINCFSRGSSSIDDQEWWDWMKAHGCSPESLQSAVVRGCYDYAFVPKDEGIGAGTATLLVLRFLLAYKGSVLHTLTEPMGDSIVAPFFEYLRDWRNVKFAFFCRVKKLELSLSRAGCRTRHHGSAGLPERGPDAIRALDEAGQTGPGAGQPDRTQTRSSMATR